MVVDKQSKALSTEKKIVFLIEHLPLDTVDFPVYKQTQLATHKDKNGGREHGLCGQFFFGNMSAMFALWRTVIRRCPHIFISIPSSFIYTLYMRIQNTTLETVASYRNIKNTKHDCLK